MRYDTIIGEMVWSYSRLTAFENCPYQWMLHYIYGEQDEPKFFTEFGTLNHHLLQKYFSGEVSKKDLLPLFIKGFVDDIHSDPPNANIFKSYFEQGYNYYKFFSFPERKILAVEKNFQFEFAGKPFTAFVDLLSADESGALYITDHKSRVLSARSGRKKPTKSDKVLDNYLRQLYIYAYGIHEKNGVWPDYLEFNCFRSNEIICEPFRLERMEEVEAWACDTIRKITQADEWAPALNFWFCKYICGISDQCEYEELL